MPAYYTSNYASIFDGGLVSALKHFGGISIGKLAASHSKLATMNIVGR